MENPKNCAWEFLKQNNQKGHLNKISITFYTDDNYYIIWKNQATLPRTFWLFQQNYLGIINVFF